MIRAARRATLRRVIDERVRAEGGGSPIPTMRVLSRIPASRAVLLDTCFVLLLCAVHVFALGIFSPTESGASWWPLLISVPATLTLFLRRHWPLVSYSVLLAVAIGFTLFGLPVGVINLGILVAIYSICVRSSLSTAVLVGVIAMIYPFSEIAILPWHQEIINVIGSSVNLILVIGWWHCQLTGSVPGPGPWPALGERGSVTSTKQSLAGKRE